MSPSAPIQGNGPHKGALGLHGSLVGSVTGTGTGSVSMVGVRYFVEDWVGLNLEAGFSIGSAGGGLEYWVLPRRSVNASLLLNLAAVPEADTFALATVRPGIGVTLYTP